MSFFRRSRLAAGMLLLPSCLFAWMTAAEAAIAPWQTSEGGRMRIVALSRAEAGHITAVLEIEPKSGWKTYWRDPGDAGMPPELDFSAAENLTLVRTSYPVPEASDDADGRFVGYHGPARLLLDFAKPDDAAPARLAGKVVVGLCQEICLPFQAEFDLPLDPAGVNETEEADIVLQARDALPEAPSGDFQVTSSGLTADRSAYHIAITLPVEGQPAVFPVPSHGLRFGRPVSIRVAGKTAEISIPIKKLPKSPEGAGIDLLVKTGSRAMETTLALE